MGHREEREVQRDWMLVELRESEPVALEESRLIRAVGEEIESIKTYYISHGVSDQSLPNDFFGINWSKTAINRFKAILVISPGWRTSKPAVCVASRVTETSCDFNGSPSKNYEEKYTASQLARRVKELLMEAGIMKNKKEHTGRTLDHVPLIPLYFMHPNADIPVCQLSIQSNKDGVYHYNLGRAVSPLKDEGVLVLGSSISANNFGNIDLQGCNRPLDRASAFDSWLDDCIANNRFEEVIQFEQSSSLAVKAHPSPAHLYPLLVALGAAGEGAEAQSIPGGWTFG